MTRPATESQLMPAAFTLAVKLVPMIFRSGSLTNLQEKATMTFSLPSCRRWATGLCTPLILAAVTVRMAGRLPLTRANPHT